MPHGEFGLDVIALVGRLRFAEPRSAPEIHQALLVRGVQLAERTVTDLAQRYEEVVAFRLAGQTRLRERLAEQERAILALGGLQLDRGHEVLWVIRECLSREVLLALGLLSATQGDLVALLREVRAALPIPISGAVSDGQSSTQAAVRAVSPGVPHPLCQCHYLREAGKPIAVHSRLSPVVAVRVLPDLPRRRNVASEGHAYRASPYQRRVPRTGDRQDRERSHDPDYPVRARIARPGGGMAKGGFP